MLPTINNQITMDILTINQLLAACQEQVAKGNGEKKILLSADEEGNEYHGMYFLFTPTEEVFTGGRFDPYLHDDVPLEEAIILG